MKKVLYCIIMCICCICISCQSSEQIMIDAVNQVNSSCPIEISKLSTITKVEFVNNEVIFYITYDESEDSFQDYTYQDLKRLESNPKFVKDVMKDIFRQPTVKAAFKDMTLKVAEEINLNLKAVVKGNSSNLELVCKMSWTDVLLVNK